MDNTIIFLIASIVIIILGVGFTLLGIFCNEFGNVTIWAILLIFIGILGAFCWYKSNKEQKYVENRTKFYVAKVASKGYLTDDIKLDIKNDFNIENLDVGKLKIEGTSKNENSKQIYLELTYDGQTYLDTEHRN